MVGRYREAICKVYEGYMLDIARFGDGEVMVKLKRTRGSVSRTVPRLNPLCSANSMEE
jgi:hypothetical protein